MTISIFHPRKENLMHWGHCNSCASQPVESHVVMKADTSSGGISIRLCAVCFKDLRLQIARMFRDDDHSGGE